MCSSRLKLECEKTAHEADYIMIEMAWQQMCEYYAIVPCRGWFWSVVDSTPAYSECRLTSQVYVPLSSGESVSMEYSRVYVTVSPLFLSSSSPFNHRMRGTISLLSTSVILTKHFNTSLSPALSEESISILTSGGSTG